MRQFFLVLFVALSCPVSAEPIDSTEIRVIDGDTIRVRHTSNPMYASSDLTPPRRDDQPVKRNES
jgi:endonuclease YncB( thermonuclease family)